MKIPFTWKVTGWFMIGWSQDFPVGEIKPLHYFGQDLVAYRTEDGELHVLIGALPAPRRTPRPPRQGQRRLRGVPVPRLGVGPRRREQATSPTRTDRTCSKRLRRWPVLEQYDCVFIWHQPHGEPPALGDATTSSLAPRRSRPTPPTTTAPGPRCAPAPTASRCTRSRPRENAPDSAHFQYVHRATVRPVREYWNVDGPRVAVRRGLAQRQERRPERRCRCASTATTTASASAITAFSGAQNHRLVFASTPVDDKTSDMFYSIWWPTHSRATTRRRRPRSCARRCSEGVHVPRWRTTSRSGATRTTSSTR